MNNEGFDFTSELDSMDEQYQNAPEDAGSTYEDVPDGKYQVRIQDAELTRSKTSNAPMIKMKLRIEGPSHINRLLWRNSVIAADKLEWIKKDLTRLGLKLGKLSELPNVLSSVKGVLIEVTVKKNGDFQNIYIDKKLAGVGQGAPAQQTQGNDFASGTGVAGSGFNPNDDMGVPF